MILFVNRAVPRNRKIIKSIFDTFQTFNNFRHRRYHRRFTLSSDLIIIIRSAITRSRFSSLLIAPICHTVIQLFVNEDFDFVICAYLSLFDFFLPL